MPAAYLIAVAFIALIAITMTVLAWSIGCFDGTWAARAAAAVTDFLRPSTGIPHAGVQAPTAKATRPRRPGAHRAANRTTRKRVNA